MTTKVTITNHGPNPVQPKKMERKCGESKDGGFPREFWWESKLRVGPLFAGQSEDFYVHASQRIDVVELQMNGIDETAP